MKTRIIQKNKIAIVAIITILIILGLLIRVFFIYGDGQVAPEYKENLMFNYNWNYEWINSGKSGKINLPYTATGGNENEILRISNIIPEVHRMYEPILFFRTSQQYLKVYIEDELIYSYDNNRENDTVPGSAWHFIELPKDYANKRIDIVFRSPFRQYIGHLNTIEIGTRSNCILSILYTYNFTLINSFLMLILGVVLIGIFISIKDFKEKPISIFHLGMFSLLIGIWTMAESKIAQLFYYNPPVIFYIACISLFLMPIPLLLFLISDYGIERHRSIKFFIAVYVLFFGTVSLLEFLGIRAYMNGITIFHIITIIVFISTIIILLMELKKGNKETKSFFIALLFFVIFGCFDMYNYYFSSNPKLNAQKLTQLGLIIFFIIMFIKVGNFISNFYRVKSKNDMIEYVAYHDVLTGMKNRTCFEKDLKKFDESNYNKKNMTFILFDFDNLKIMNDTFGHEVGDKLLIDGSKIIEKQFKNIGDLYRIGGDEFVLITNTNQNEIVKYTNRFEQMIIYNNKTNKTNISISYGISSYDIEKDNNLRETLKRADELMYDRKNLNKKKKQVNN